MSTDPKDYVRRSDGNISVMIGPIAETFTGASIGCLRGDLQTSDSFALSEEDERNWCRDLDAAVTRAILGGRTLEVSGELDMIPDDASFEDLVDYYTNKTPFLLQIIYSNDQTVATTMTELYEVVLTEFPRTAPLDGTAYVGFSMRVQAIRSDMVIA